MRSHLDEDILALMEVRAEKALQAVTWDFQGAGIGIDFSRDKRESRWGVAFVVLMACYLRSQAKL